MKKFIYSIFSLALAATLTFTSCKPDDEDPTTKPVPTITFQNNNSTFSGYTFSDEVKTTGENIKIGVRITHTVNLKTLKLTQKLNSDPATTVPSIFPDSTFTAKTKTANKDVAFALPTTKGVYVYTFTCVDEDGASASNSLKITVSGPLGDADGGKIYSIKALGSDKPSAYDLFEDKAITASDPDNVSNRDIEDMSTGAALGKKWRSRNGTQFIAGQNINGKTFSQFRTESDVITAWEALKSTASSEVNIIDENTLVIAKFSRGGATYYAVIGFSAINDENGSEDDYYEITYKY